MNSPLWFSNLVSWSEQVALLVLFSGLLLRLFEVRQPQVRLALFRGLLLVTLVLPIVQPWHRLPAAPAVSLLPDAAAIYSTMPPAVTHWHFFEVAAFAEGVGMAIVGGIALRMAFLGLGLLRLRALRHSSVPVPANDPLAAILNQMLAAVRVRAEFRLSADVESPVTFGLVNPVVLLPESFVATAPRLQSVIACHESLHARRRDWAQHLVEEIVRSVFWFHPAILWLISHIRVTREQLVDLEVVRLTNARKDYLDALLEFTQRRARFVAIPAPPFLAEHQLVERISLISKEVHMSRRKLIGSLVVISTALCVVVGLSAWSFPMKRSSRPSDSTLVDGAVSGAVATGISGGVSGGVAGGVNGGATGAVIGGVIGGLQATSNIPEVDSSTIWVDTVKRGPMLRQVRGMGKLVRVDGSTTVVAQVNLPAFMTADVKLGQNASIDSQKGPVATGHVVNIGPSGSGDTRTVELALDGVPAGASAGLEVAGTIDIEKIDGVLQVGRPVHGVQNKEIPLFRLDNDGKDAVRVDVKLGRASVTTVEVLAGLEEGDRVILSDMSQIGRANRVHIVEPGHTRLQ